MEIELYVPRRFNINVDDVKKYLVMNGWKKLEKSHLSDFDTYSDWLSMGFSERGVDIIMEFLSYPEIHQNNPLIFIEMLEDAPHRDDMIEPFNEKYGEYGLTRKDRIHEGVKYSLVNNMRNVWYRGGFIERFASPKYSNVQVVVPFSDNSDFRIMNNFVVDVLKLLARYYNNDIEDIIKSINDA